MDNQKHTSPGNGGTGTGLGVVAALRAGDVSAGDFEISNTSKMLFIFSLR